jgi:hypothetical protein
MAAPTYEQLIAFAAGELPMGEAAAVAAHVQGDPDAAAVVSAWRTASETLRRDDSVAPSAAAMQRARAIFAQRAATMSSSTSRVAGWIESAQRFLAHLAYDSRVQPAAVRFAGDDDRINLTFETEEGDIDVQAERLRDEDSAESRWRVVGQISDAGSDEDDGPREVALVRHDEAIPVVLAITDEHGVFALETDSGAYELLIRAAAKAGSQTTAAERIIVLSPVELPG